MQARSEETRKKIIDEAERLFSQSGYDATGVAEICQAASISKGAFYHHFPSKHAVFMQLLEKWLVPMDENFQLVHQRAPDVPSALIEMAGLLDKVFLYAGERLPIFLEFWTQAHRDPEIWQITIAPYRRYQEFFAGLIREGIEEGSVRPVNPDATARVLIALALGLLLQSVLDPQGAPWGRFVQDSIRNYLDVNLRRSS
jgi:AcrR family transcriptional regulator